MIRFEAAGGVAGHFRAREGERDRAERTQPQARPEASFAGRGKTNLGTTRITEDRWPSRPRTTGAFMPRRLLRRLLPLGLALLSSWDTRSELLGERLSLRPVVEAAVGKSSCPRALPVRLMSDLTANHGTFHFPHTLAFHTTL